MSLVKGSRFQRYQVQPHHPVKKWLLRLSLVIMVIISILAAYLYGSASKDTNRAQWLLDRIESDKNRASLAEQLLTANNKLSLLSEQLQLQQQSILIDQQQIQQLQAASKEQLEQMNELKKQLSFYQSVMSPSAQQSTVSIEQLNLLGQTLNFTLKQSSANPLKVEGLMQAQLLGQINGQPHTVQLEFVQAKLESAEQTEDNTSVKFAFRFFQTFKLAIELPEDFKPEQLIISAKNKNNKQLFTKRTIAWQQLLAK